MSQSTLSNSNDLSTKEITLKSLKEEIYLFRQNKSHPNDPLPDAIWNQLHVLLMKHSVTECARELNLTRTQVERELIVALNKVSPPSRFSLCPKAPGPSVEPTVVFQEIQILDEEATPGSIPGLVPEKNQESRPVEQVPSMAATKTLAAQTRTAEESGTLSTVGVPDTLKKPAKEQPEATTPLNYKAAKAFSTKTAVVEIKRPDGMLMAISICTDRFEELLSAFFKGCPA